MPKPRAVLYIRLSRESAVSTSIEGQNADLYALAAREGWEIVATFEDNGKSGGKQRDNARAALDMLRSSEADVLAVYAYDRWSRMGIADSAEVIKAIYERQELARKGRAPAPLFYAAREGIRSDQEGWEIRVAFAADVAQKERDRMVARRTAAIERMRAQGRNPGNGPAPFGYRSAPFPDGRPGRRFVPDPAEAAVIREVADRLIAGESSTSVARDLTARGVPMPRSAARLALMRGEPTDRLDRGTWSSSRVSQLWVSDHLLGRVAHRTNRSANGGTSRSGELMLDPVTGMPLQPYEPILSVETMLALRARFDNTPGKGRQLQRRAARLLSGLIFCGVCDSPLYALSYLVRGKRYEYYRCSGPSRGKECGGLRISATKVEEIVTERYLRAFGDLPAVQTIEHKGAPEIEEAVAVLTEQINAAAAQLADEHADVEAILARRADLMAKRATLRDSAPVTTVERVELGIPWRELFESTDSVDKRREYLSAVYDHVEILPASEEDRVRLRHAPEAHEEV